MPGQEQLKKKRPKKPGAMGEADLLDGQGEENVVPEGIMGKLDKALQELQDYANTKAEGCGCSGLWL